MDSPGLQPILRRSAAVAAVVGTLLTAVNQGGRLLAGPPDGTLLARALFNYLVPFAVATAGALLDRRGPR